MDLLTHNNFVTVLNNIKPSSVISKIQRLFRTLQLAQHSFFPILRCPMVSLATASESLKVWKFEKDDLSLVSRFSPPTGRCSCFAWNHTNQVVAVGGTESKIFLIHAHNGQILSSLQISEDNGTNLNASSVALSSNSRFLATSLKNNIQVWDLKRRQLKSVMDDHVQDVTSTCFLPTGEIVSGDTSGAVRIWDSKAYLSSMELLATPDRSEAVTSLSISPVSSAHLAAGYSSGMLSVWDTATFQQLRRLTAHTGSLNSVANSPINPKLVATAGSDSRVTLFDTGTRSSGTPSAVIQLAESVNITTVAFHEDALHAAIGLSNGRVMVYDWRKTSRPVLDKPAHDHFPVLALAFQVPKSKTTEASATGSVSSVASAMRTATAAAPVVTAAAVPSSVPPVPAKAVPITPPSKVTSAASRTSEAGMSTPVNSSLQRLDHVISPIAPVRSHDPYDAAVLPPPPPPTVDNGNSGVGNKYSLNHSRAFPEEQEADQIPSRRVLHASPTPPQPPLSTHVHVESVHVDVSDDHALNHSRTFPEKHSPEKVNPMRAAQNAKAAASSAQNTATAAATKEPLQPRSVIKGTERSSSHISRADAQNTTSAVYPQAQLEVSFDRSVDSHSHSYPQHTARAPHNYLSPQKLNGRADREESDFARNNHHNGGKSEHTLRTTNTTSSASNYTSHHTSNTMSNHTSNNAHTHAPSSHLLNASIAHDYAPQEGKESREVTEEKDPHTALRQAVRPVTARDLEESLDLLKYDLHREMQDIIKEQIRQFSIAKEDTASMLKEMSAQMAEILQANKELRAENEYLRRIY